MRNKYNEDEIQENPFDVDTEQQLSIQDEINQEAQNLPETLEQPTNPIESLREKFRKYQELRQIPIQQIDDKSLEDAQNERNKKQMLSLILQGTQQIGQGFANRYAPNFKADTSVAQNIMKMADQPVEDLQRNIKTKNSQQEQNDRNMESALKLETADIDLMNREQGTDPNSNYSKVIQDFIIDTNKNIDPEAVRKSSAEQLLKLSPQLSQLIGRKIAAQRLSRPVTKEVERDGKVYIYKYNPQTESFEDTGLIKGYAPAIVRDSYTGENKMVSKGTQTQNILDTNAPKVDQKGKQLEQTPFEKLEPKLRDDFSKNHASDFEKETKESQQKLSTLASLNELASTVRNSTPEDKKSNLNAFATAVASFYQKGVLSDKDVERYIKTPDLKSKFINAISSAASGTLDDTTVDQIMNGVNIIAKEQSNFIKNQAEEKSKQFYNKHRSSLESKNIKELDFAKQLMPDYKPTTQTNNSEIIRRDPKTGKNAVFNATTKEFIRWEK